MSGEQSAAWVAIPLGHLHMPARRDVVARRLGMHVDDLADLIDGDHTGVPPLAFTVEDATTIDTVDGVVVLCWSHRSAADGGEGDAIALRDTGIPHLRWWYGARAYSAGAEVFTGTGEPVCIRTDEDLVPIVGIIERSGRFVPDATELAEANEWLSAKVQTLHSRKPNG